MEHNSSRNIRLVQIGLDYPGWFDFVMGTAKMIPNVSLDRSLPLPEDHDSDQYELVRSDNSRPRDVEAAIPVRVSAFVLESTV